MAQVFQIGDVYTVAGLPHLASDTSVHATLRDYVDHLRSECYFIASPRGHTHDQVASGFEPNHAEDVMEDVGGIPEPDTCCGDACEISSAHEPDVKSDADSATPADEVGSAQHTAVPRPQLAEPSVEDMRVFPIPPDTTPWWWTRLADHVRRGVLKCFCMDDIIADWEVDAAVVRDVRNNMRKHVKVTGYSFARPHADPANDADNEVSVETAIGFDIKRVNGSEVKHVPKLVANAVVVLRMKLGLGAMDRSVPGNVAVVRKEAAKLLREYPGLRKMDAAAHLLLIERAFFEDDTHYRVTTWRARAAQKSRFVKWVLGTSDPPGFDY